MNFLRIFGIMNPQSTYSIPRGYSFFESPVRGYCRHVSNRITRNLRGGSWIRTIHMKTVTMLWMTSVSRMHYISTLGFSWEGLVVRPNPEIRDTGKLSRYILKGRIMSRDGYAHFCARSASFNLKIDWSIRVRMM